MPLGPHQVVGLIEIDHQQQFFHQHPLQPADPLAQRRGHRRQRCPETSGSLVADIIAADLDQLDDQLRVELAELTSRIRSARRHR